MNKEDSYDCRLKWATLSYAKIKAVATGNPLIKEKMQFDLENGKTEVSRDDTNTAESE